MTKLFPLLLLVFIIACDHGLNPEADTVVPGFDGMVVLAEGWSRDSEIGRLYIVVFKTIPPSVDEIFPMVSRGEIVFKELTPPFQGQYEYSFDIDPGVYEMVACVGLKGDLIFDLSSWVLAGLYAESENPEQAQPITVPNNDRLHGVNISASVVSPLPLPF